MSPQEFIRKWQGDISGHWASTPDLLYWARMYNMSREDKHQMSKDYLSVPGIDMMSISYSRAKVICD